MRPCPHASTAVDRQLGLKLERRQGKGQVLVIDAIDEEPREN
jgi:uncharacterized protein (TIGR03435 family)